MSPPTVIWFRVSALLLAVIVGLQALWLLIAELAPPPLPFSPAGKQGADAVAADRGRATLVRTLGVARNDLWTNCAIALALERALERVPPATAPSNEVRSLIECAILVGPHDARSWLLLAVLEGNRDLGGPLKMSFYTGPNDASLMPMRLAIATRSDVIADPELQVVVTNDLRTIVLRRPNLKPAIEAAYRDASPDGKRFMETAVAKLDPNFVAEFVAKKRESPN
jgi:hypothetical protein